MKLTTIVNLTHILASVRFISKSAKNQTVNKNGGALININTNSNPLYSHPTDVGCLKSFDTALIAYHLMGLNNLND
nr:hypothetical protein [Nostoc sp. ChiQUE02]MDZ8231810.1 hypothetical protein [Nostoc sp. ChiQUE02]